MIKMFNIPSYTIKTSAFKNLLHDEIVHGFEQSIAFYVNAHFAVSFNSATSAIFLLFSYLKKSMGLNRVGIPVTMPPVVANALINAGIQVDFKDEWKWVGYDYIMYEDEYVCIVDSAQKIEEKQFDKLKKNNKTQVIIYSFYPTKPIGSCDGGMIVTNNSKLASDLRSLANNGICEDTNESWHQQYGFIGHKMYMNSISAYIASENFKKLEEKYHKLDKISRIYDEEFDHYPRLHNRLPRHLYRVSLSYHFSSNNEDEIPKIIKSQKSNIAFGRHYKPLCQIPVYGKEWMNYYQSRGAYNSIITIPFHENLTEKEIKTVVNFIKQIRLKQRDDF
jgi:dTDP-4-amino-4,6-dideoxygalactose transaminase